MIMFFQRNDSYRFVKTGSKWNPKILKAHSMILTVIIFEDGKLKEIL